MVNREVGRWNDDEERMMLDADLAMLYDVETKVLVQAVQVNIEIMRAFVKLRALAADHKALDMMFDQVKEQALKGRRQ